MSSARADASAVIAQLIVFVVGRKLSRIIAAMTAVMLAVDARSGPAQSVTGCPETRRFGARLTKPVAMEPMPALRASVSRTRLRTRRPIAHPLFAFTGRSPCAPSG